MENNRFLSFILNNEEMAISLLRIKEIISFNQKIVPIPLAPKHLLGIINLRSTIIPIVDLRLKLNLPISPKNEETSIIVIDCNGFETGVVVDQVNSVHLIKEENVSPPPTIDSKSKLVIDGVFKKGDNLILMIDILKILSNEDSKLIQQNFQKVAS